MLHDVSESVRECLLRAEQCRRMVESARDERTRTEFSDMEQRWLYLAESYQFCDRLSRWIRKIDHRQLTAGTASAVHEWWGWRRKKWRARAR
jgi:hypothetical protein